MANQRKTRYPRHEFEVETSKQSGGNYKVRLVHLPCGTGRVTWNSNIRPTMSCPTCSEPLPASVTTHHRWMLVEADKLTSVEKLPNPLPAGAVIFRLRSPSSYTLATPLELAGHLPDEAPRHPDPLPLPVPAQSAPAPSRGYKQFLAVPFAYAGYITSTSSSPLEIEDAAEAFIQAYMPSDYAGTLTIGEDWWHNDEHFCYIYPPTNVTLALNPTGLGGSPARIFCDEGVDHVSGTGS